MRTGGRHERGVFLTIFGPHPGHPARVSEAGLALKLPVAVRPVDNGLSGPPADQSAAIGAGPRVIARRGRMRVALSRGGWGGAVVALGRASSSPAIGRSNRAVFPWTPGCGACPMRV